MLYYRGNVINLLTEVRRSASLTLTVKPFTATTTINKLVF